MSAEQAQAVDVDEEARIEAEVQADLAAEEAQRQQQAAAEDAQRQAGIVLSCIIGPDSKVYADTEVTKLGIAGAYAELILDEQSRSVASQILPAVLTTAGYREKWAALDKKAYGGENPFITVFKSPNKENTYAYISTPRNGQDGFILRALVGHPGKGKWVVVGSGHPAANALLRRDVGSVEDRLFTVKQGREKSVIKVGEGYILPKDTIAVAFGYQADLRDPRNIVVLDGDGNGFITQRELDVVRDAQIDELTDDIYVKGMIAFNNAVGDRTAHRTQRTNDRQKAVDTTVKKVINEGRDIGKAAKNIGGVAGWVAGGASKLTIKAWERKTAVLSWGLVGVAAMTCPIPLALTLAGINAIRPLVRIMVMPVTGAVIPNQIIRERVEFGFVVAAGLWAHFSGAREAFFANPGIVGDGFMYALGHTYDFQRVGPFMERFGEFVSSAGHKADLVQKVMQGVFWDVIGRPKSGGGATCTIVDTEIGLRVHDNPGLNNQVGSLSDGDTVKVLKELPGNVLQVVSEKASGFIKGEYCQPK
jgi:hypothetical protein